MKTNDKVIVFAWDVDKEELYNLTLEFSGRVYISNKWDIPIVAISYTFGEDKESEIILKANSIATLGQHEICDLALQYDICAGTLGKNYQLNCKRTLNTLAEYKEAIKFFESHYNSASILERNENFISLNRRVIAASETFTKPITLCSDVLEHRLFIKPGQ